MLYRCTQKNKTNPTTFCAHQQPVREQQEQAASQGQTRQQARVTTRETQAGISQPHRTRGANRVQQKQPGSTNSPSRYKASPRTSQANKPARHTGRYTTRRRLVRALGACWHAHGPDVAICPDSLDMWFLVSKLCGQWRGGAQRPLHRCVPTLAEQMWAEQREVGLCSPWRAPLRL